MRLADAGLTLLDVELGGIDAESDRRLSSYFIATPVVNEVIAGRRSLVLGRKGSGKSAIFTQLERLYDRSGPEVLVLGLTPDEYAWATLKRYEEQGLSAEQAHTNAWRYTIAVEVAWLLTTLETTWTENAATAVDTLRRFIEDNYEGRVDLTRTARSLLSGVGSLNLSAFGISFGVQRGNGLEQRIAVTPMVVQALIDLLSVPLSERGVVVALDRLDDSWDRQGRSKALLIGLLKAAKDLNDSFGLSESGGLRVISFLRTDIYQELHFDDKDKHRATEIHLAWSSDELRDMLDARLPPGVITTDLFEVGPMRGGIEPFNYVAKRTFLRPREVLQFVELAITTQGRDATEIGKDAIREAESRYSSWKVDDLKQEFGGHTTILALLIECLRQEHNRYDSIEELETLISRKHPDLVERFSARQLVSGLFSAGVVGVRVGNAGSPRFISENAELVLPSDWSCLRTPGIAQGPEHP